MLTRNMTLLGRGSRDGLLRLNRGFSRTPNVQDKSHPDKKSSLSSAVCCDDDDHTHSHPHKDAQNGTQQRPMNEADREQKRNILSAHYRDVLHTLGEDVGREGLLKTPDRAAKAMLEFTHGYTQDPKQILRQALFHEETNDQLVMLRDIEFFSLCEHHLVPFVVKATILYQPSGKIVGLSKLARITDAYARRLQVQERMTKDIAECLQDVLEPKGVAVKLEATHFCMAMRGVRKSGVTTTTTFMTGVFKTNHDSRREAMSHLNQTNP